MEDERNQWKQEYQRLMSIGYAKYGRRWYEED